MNKWFLSGKIYKQPVLSKTKNGGDVCYLTIRAKQYNEFNFYPLKVYGAAARFIAKYSAPKAVLSLEGTIEVRWIEFRATLYLGCHKAEILSGGRSEKVLTDDSHIEQVGE